MNGNRNPSFGLAPAAVMEFFDALVLTLLASLISKLFSDNVPPAFFILRVGSGPEPGFGIGLCESSLCLGLR